MKQETITHGPCVDCGSPVVSGEGVTIDPAGAVWHSDCRRVYNRKNPSADPAAAKRGPGRPRKAEVTA